MFRKILVCLALAAVATSGAEARPLTAKDMAMLDRLSDPHVSPDGRFVAYNVRSTDWDENRGYNALWVLDRSEPGAAPRLIRDHQKGGTEPRWSDDGRWLYFLSDRSGSEQLWRTPADSAAATQITSLPVDVMFYHVARDGRRIVIAANVYPDCDTLACSKAKDDAKAKVKATGTVYEGATPRFWDTYLDGRYINLFAVTLKSEGTASEALALTRGYQADIVSRPEGDDASFEIAPDGERVIFAARPSGSAQGLGDPSSLYTVAIDGKGGVKRLDDKATTSDDAPAFSPDGGLLAYLSSTGPTFTAPRAHVMLRDMKTGATRDLTSGWDRSPTGLQWSPDGSTLFALAEDVGQVKLFAIDAASGVITPQTEDGHIAGFDVSKGAIVYARDALDSPDEIYALTAGDESKRLTNVGGDILSQTPMSHFEQFSFTGWNGETVHGYVVEPANYEAGKKYPVAFLIHGGPHGSFGNAWSYRWNPQAWSGMGYAAVMIDFHGSSGYGDAFGKSIIGHWGDRPLEDLQKGWAAALAKYPYLDGDRACALGGSYGGYMVAWIAGNWAKPWKCLVDHDGVFDIRLMSYSTDIPGFQQQQNGAASWVDTNAVEQFNPIDHAAAWSDPILVVHSGRDARVPLDQGMGAYGLAQLRHIPSELLYFPDENHWVLKPQNSVMWYATVESWMKKWLEK